MRRLFISDLHLSPETPFLTQAFLTLLDVQKSKVNELYIVGDWFETWIGDDDDAVFLNDVVAGLNAFVTAGSKVFYLHGNRDFVLGQAFMDRFGGTLLPPEITLQQGNLSIRIEHGDALCTDDVKYQAFRTMSRNPLWQQAALSQPIDTRRQMAAMLRMQSKASNANDAGKIVDVNNDAVLAAIGEHNILVHGHTHRPQIHPINNTQTRIVLGDWREADAEAMIGFLDDDGFTLELFHF